MEGLQKEVEELRAKLLEKELNQGLIPNNFSNKKFLFIFSKLQKKKTKYTN